MTAVLARLASARHCAATAASVRPLGSLPLPPTIHPFATRKNPPPFQQHQMAVVVTFSSSSGFGKSHPSIPFRPRRRAPKDYRPYQVPQKVVKEEPFFNVNDNPKLIVNLSESEKDAKNEMEATYGPHLAEAFQQIRREQKTLRNDQPFGLHDDLEENIKIADYMTAEPGSTEELIFNRRSFEHYTPEEKKEEEEEMQKELREAERLWLYPNMLEQNEYRKLMEPKPKKGEAVQHLFDSAEEDLLYSPDEQDERLRNERNREAHGNWSEYLVDVRRGNHNWRGGRLESYRALVVGGNGNGCGGFGVGQAGEAMKAIDIAGRKCRRNIFFVDRFQQDGLTRDLVGRHNDCQAVMRQRSQGLRGNVLMCEILARFGVTAAACKVYGPRHPWNVVYATFKALMTHESAEDIAMKTGKRLIHVDKAIRLGI